MLASKALADHQQAPREVASSLPEATHVFAPPSAEDAADILRSATDERATVLFYGHGTRQGLGAPFRPDVVMSTTRMNRIVAWEPDDLTLAVEPGASVRDVEAELATRNQTAGLPEWDDAGTIGGVVATGSSGYRRARLGPTRDRLLEVEIVTGDGRLVHGGGRVVKNVSGYDLPRLAAGSMGRLGLLSSVCFKLWPLPEAAATIELDMPPAVVARRLYRPLAVLESRTSSTAMVQGTSAEVAAQSKAAGGTARDGLHWPASPRASFTCSLRLSPSDLVAAVGRLPESWDFVAQHGVGVIDAACVRPDPDDIQSLRNWAEQRGGALVVSEPGGMEIDPWGRLPEALDLQRRVIAGFDPYGIANPGRLPGGI